MNNFNYITNNDDIQNLKRLSLTNRIIKENGQELYLNYLNLDHFIYLTNILNKLYIYQESRLNYINNLYRKYINYIFLNISDFITIYRRYDINIEITNKDEILNIKKFWSNNADLKKKFDFDRFDRNIPFLDFLLLYDKIIELVRYNIPKQKIINDIYMKYTSIILQNYNNIIIDNESDIAQLQYIVDNISPFIYKITEGDFHNQNEKKEILKIKQLLSSSNFYLNDLTFLFRILYNNYNISKQNQQTHFFLNNRKIIIDIYKKYFFRSLDSRWISSSSSSSSYIIQRNIIE